MIIWREGESERGREASERERERELHFLFWMIHGAPYRDSISQSLLVFIFDGFVGTELKPGHAMLLLTQLLYYRATFLKLSVFFTFITSSPSLCRAVCRHRLVNFFMTIGIWVPAKKGKGKVPKTTNTFNELNCCLKQFKSECKITGKQSYLVATWASNPRLMQSYRITDKKTNICA